MICVAGEYNKAAAGGVGCHYTHVESLFAPIINGPSRDTESEPRIRPKIVFTRQPEMSHGKSEMSA